MPDKYVWNEAILLPDGHRLFSENSDPFNKVAIADESGRFPDETDDGVLWLDQSKPIEIGRDDDSRHHERVIIPLLTEDGQETRTIGNGATAIVIAQLLNMKIKIGRDFYGVHSKES